MWSSHLDSLIGLIWSYIRQAFYEKGQIVFQALWIIGSLLQLLKSSTRVQKQPQTVSKQIGTTRFGSKQAKLIVVFFFYMAGGGGSLITALFLSWKDLHRKGVNSYVFYNSKDYKLHIYVLLFSEILHYITKNKGHKNTHIYYSWKVWTKNYEFLIWFNSKILNAWYVINHIPRDLKLYYIS